MTSNTRHDLLRLNDGLSLYSSGAVDWTLSLWAYLPSTGLAINPSMGEVVIVGEYVTFRVVVTNVAAFTTANYSLRYNGYGSLIGGTALSPPVWTLNAWHHLVLRHYQAQSSWEIWFDGVQASDSILSVSGSCSTSQSFGGWQYFGANDAQWPGYLDELWYFPFAVPDAAITDLYLANTLLVCPPGTYSLAGDGSYSLGCGACSLGVPSCSHADSGLRAHYSFDTDYSDWYYTNPAALQNVSGATGAPNTPIPGQPSRFGGGALQLNHAQVADVFLPLSVQPLGIPGDSLWRDWTMAFWLQPSSGWTNNDFYGGLSQCAYNTNQQCSFRLLWNGGFNQAINLLVNRCQLSSPSSCSYFFIQSNAALSALQDGNWHHLAVTMSRTVQSGVGYGNISLYVDGLHDSSVLTQLSGYVVPLIGATAPIAVGADLFVQLNTGRGCFSGSMDELVLLGYALTAKQALYLKTNNQLDLCAGGSYYTADYRSSLQASASSPLSSPITSCAPCPAGSVTPVNSVGYTACNKCNNGAHAPSQGMSACISCLAGYYAPNDGGAYSECLPCHNGTYQDQAGQSTCKPCSSGQVALNDELGHTSCVVCDSGLFAVNDGNSACNVCPPGASTGGTANVCNLCSPGQWVVRGRLQQLLVLALLAQLRRLPQRHSRRPAARGRCA